MCPDKSTLFVQYFFKLLIRIDLVTVSCAKLFGFLEKIGAYFCKHIFYIFLYAIHRYKFLGPSIAAANLYGSFFKVLRANSKPYRNTFLFIFCKFPARDAIFI